MLVRKFEQETGPSQRSAVTEQRSEFRSRSNWLFAKVMLCARKIADVRDRACAINVAANFLRISFTHENAALAPKRAVPGALGDLARRAVVVTNFVSRIQSINAGRKMQCRRVQFFIDLQIMRGRRHFARSYQSRMAASGTRKK